MGVKITSNKKGVTKEANKRAEFTLTDFAEVMVGVAKEKSPWDTGHNSRSIRMEPKNGVPVRVGGRLVIRVITESGYGAILEIGSSKMPARPYMRPGFDAARKRLPAIAEAYNK